MMQTFTHFKISVDNIIAVKITESKADLSSIELCSLLRELSFLGEVVEQLPTIHVLEYEAQLVLCGE